MANSQRTVLNANFVDNTFDYQFINHIQVLGNGISPVDNFWFTPGNSPQWSSAILDSAGWPNAPGVSGHQWGGHVLLPSSSNYSTYQIDWVGEGQLLLASGTWTVIASSGLSAQSNGNYTGINASITLTYSGPKAQIGWRVLQTNQTGNGYFRSLRFYRAADAADLASGKIFRAPYKQIIATMNPSAIRFMNWTGSNNATQNRFENRATPLSATYGGGIATVSPPYQETTGANLMSLASAVGMPVAMQHGEIVTARIGSGEVRAGNITVSAITKANPGVVTASSHGFLSGDAVVFQISVGMIQLDHWNVVATVIDANTFSIGVDTTSFTTFSSGTVSEYASLNVGGRGAYPVVSTDGVSPLATFGSNNFLIAGDYRTFYFDKKLAASRDGSGNLIFGAWMLSPATGAGTPNYYPYVAGTPLEICTALVNEVNAISVKGPVHMWVTLPHWGLSSMDPDYSAPSNYNVGTANVILNGANGFARLTSLARLFIEYSNERWNPAFPQTSYLSRLAFLTYGTAGTSSYGAVRSVIAVTDIKSAIASSRISFVQSIQGGGGYGVGSVNYNYTQGITDYFSDPHIQALATPSAIPMSYHDLMAFASYFDLPTGANYMTKAGTGGFSDDSAMFAGTSPYSSPNQAQAIANVVAQLMSGANGQSINLYVGFLSTYATAMVAIGKGVIQYEGAQNWNVAVGSNEGSHTLTAADSSLLLAVQGSAAWATALLGYFANFKSTVGASMPAIYVMLDQRFGYASVNNTATFPDDFSGGVEGGALNATWNALAAYNVGEQRTFVLTT